MFIEFILTARASGFSFFPLQPLHGVSRINCFTTCFSACFLNEENLPLHGTMAPSSIDFDLSGITKSGSNSILTPSPLQALQEPKGELNENVLGSSSPIVMPQYGHALF